jgi:hypothetical protein
MRAWPVFYLGHGLSDMIWYLAVSLALACSGSFLSPSLHRGLIGVSGLGVAVLGMIFISHAVKDWCAPS